MITHTTVQKLITIENLKVMFNLKNLLKILFLFFTTICFLFLSTATISADDNNTKTEYRYRTKQYLNSETELTEPWICYGNRTEYVHGNYSYVYIESLITSGTGTSGGYTSSEADQWKYDNRDRYCFHGSKTSVSKYMRKTGYNVGAEYIYATSSTSVDHTKYADTGLDYWRFQICNSKTPYTLYQYYKWSDWSEWSETPVVASDEVEVETKTVAVFTILYDANGGTNAPSSTTKEFDETITLSEVIPLRENHQFLGWSTSAQGEVEYAPGAEYFANKDVTFYAVWDNPIVASGTCYYNLNWTLYQDGTFVIGGNGYVDKYSISNIPWYEYKNQIKALVIEDGVTSIYGSAFYKCTNMTEVTIKGSSLRYIDAQAFAFCEGITSVYITDPTAWCKISFGDFCADPRYYADYFYIVDDKGTFIRNIELDSTLTKIPDGAFKRCRYLESIVIPREVTTIGSSAFAYCENLKSITFQGTLSELGASAFYKCTYLNKIEIPEGVTTIKGSTFNNCRNLTSAVLPSSITSIESNAFMDCVSLKEIRLPKNVTTIESSAFSACHSLKTVFLPRKLNSIKNNAFYNCFDLETVYYSGTKAYKDRISIETSNDTLINATWYYASTIAFDANGGTGAPNSQLKDYNTDLVLSTVIPTRIGYKFMGWAINATGTVEYMPGDVYDKNESATLYAIWSVCSHNWGESAITTQPTHTSYGECTFTCNDCSATKTEQIAKTTEHSYGKWTKMDDESHKRSCACGNIETSTHNWNSGVITAQPTHTTFGERTFTCNDCSATKTEQIAKTTEHSYGKWTKKDDEFHKRSCACGNIETSTHNWDSGVITAQPTHTTFGERTFTCNDCSATKAEQIAKTTEHSFGKWTNVDTSNHSRSCECGDIETATHSWDSGVITAQPTHTTFGERSFTCNDCSATKTEQIAKTTEHSYGKWTKKDDDSHKRSCACGDIETATHSWDSGVITAQPTHTTFGERTFTCNDCSATKTEQIPTLSNIKDSGICGDSLTWVLDNEGTLTISGTGDMYDFQPPEALRGSEEGLLILPWESYLGLIKNVIIEDGVTNIGESAFCGCDNLVSVVVSGSVTSIGNFAFYSCTNLATIEIPYNVTSIGDLAFYSCAGLTAVEIPDSVTSIGECAFDSCTNLSTIEIPNSVTSIGNMAFSSCTNLTSVVIGTGVTSIATCAFESCTALTSIIIPDNVTNIGDNAFYNCTNLTICGYEGSYTQAYAQENSIPFTVIIKHGECGENLTWTLDIECTLTVSGEGDMTSYSSPPWYSYSQAIKKIVIKNGVTSIDDYAFSYCTYLTSVDIPDSITSIGNYAFEDCNNLTSIIVPDSVKTIGCGAFHLCTSLEEITIPFIGFSRDSEGEYGVFGYIFSYHDEDSDGSLGVGSFCCGAGIEQYREYKQDFYIRYCYHIPKSLKKVTFTGEKIPAGAFKNCYIIDEIELSKSLINIGDEAFYRCSGLTDVYIPESVTSIGDKAFYNCANLTICCSEGSYAQTYAQENSIPYTIWKSQIEFIGAQIRTDDPQGLRFVFSIPREKYEALSHPQSTNDTGVGFGSVVMPKKYLGDNELTKDTVVTIDGKEYKAKISPAVNLYEITDDEIKYTVCIIGISPTNYTSEYVAVPYMTYIDDTGKEITIYGECTENITVYSIAELAYQDSSSSEGVKKYLYNNILSIVDPEKYPTNK